MSSEQAYWFPAKRYGWGWGMPSVWQGWVVLLVFMLLMLLGTLMLLPSRGPVAFAAYTVVLSVGLGFVCWLKGEPPSWRWGAK